MFLVKVLRGMNGQNSSERLVVNVTLQVDQVEYYLYALAWSTINVIFGQV